MLMNHLSKHAGSIVLTAIVLSLLVVGPVSAINVDFNGLQGSHKQGSIINFKVDVEINKGSTTGEVLLLGDAIVNITKSGTKYVCMIHNDTTVVGCPFLIVKGINATGNDDYGYGFGYGNKNVHVFYNLAINSSTLVPGSYTAKAAVHNADNSQTFYSGITTFTIFDKNTCPKGNCVSIDTSLTVV